jgi:Glycosyl hydrolase family 26
MVVLGPNTDLFVGVFLRPKPTIPGKPAPKQAAYDVSPEHQWQPRPLWSDNDRHFPVAVAIYDPYLHRWAHNYIYDPSLVDKAIAQWNAGGIVGVSMTIPNPAGAGSAVDGDPINAEQVLTPDTAPHNRLIAFLNQTATDILIPLKNARVPILFRYMKEMDGSWSWWGDVTLGGFGKFNGSQQTRL